MYIYTYMHICIYIYTHIHIYIARLSVKSPVQKSQADDSASSGRLTLAIGSSSHHGGCR